MRLELLRGHGCLSAFTCVCPSIHLSASHDKQIVVQIVGAISKKIILIIPEMLIACFKISNYVRHERDAYVPRKKFAMLGY